MGLSLRDCREEFGDCKEADYQKKPLTTQYIACLYISVAYLFGLGQNTEPFTDSERLFTILLCLFGACAQATIFGSVAAVICGLDAEETQFRKKVTTVAGRMRALNMPEKLRRRVLEYYEMQMKLGHNGDDFMEDLNPSLRCKVKLWLFRDWVENIPFFQNPEISTLMIEGLVVKLVTNIYLPGELVMRKGESGDWMGFIGRGGRVSILDPTRPDAERKVVNKLGEGEYVFLRPAK